MAPWAKAVLAIFTRQLSTSQEEVRGQYLARGGRGSSPVPPGILRRDEVEVEVLPGVAPLLHQLQRLAPPLAGGHLHNPALLLLP